jgi:acetoin utilization deacetylase AcuC-like enzyme
MLKIAHSAIYAHSLPEGHRFPMLKYELIPEQLLHEGSINPNHLFVPESCTASDLLLTHDLAYYQRLIHLQLSSSEQRVIGFPQSEELILREHIITQGTIDCSLYALEHGCAMNVAGGTHHAFADRGEGFCLLNDMAVAANYLLHRNLVKRILIIDLDVHQGNGTAKLMESVNEVFTCSVHGKNNYPFRKEKSNLDIGLEDGISGEAYLRTLSSFLPELLDTFQPDFVFYLAGVDVLATDKLGKFKLSISDCKRRDKFVLDLMHKNRIPVSIALGGGYSPNIKDIVEAHCNTFRLALDLFDS